ncbi:SAV_915 family protein [Rhodococcus xishaensis]|uniref:SAV_915 family protein n=1 Tax=Rhodococcus xishaensis TaxID=2487364 RepID=UPI001F2F5AE1|nr:SAV_915 family protein [Rhodococcus xishaensis]
MTSPIPAEFPPVVYLPCAKDVADPEHAEIELRRTRDGRMALLAYSALDRLHACCGAHQPWIVVGTPALDLVMKSQPFDLLLLDVVIPEAERRGPVL